MSDGEYQFVVEVLMDDPAKLAILVLHEGNKEIWIPRSVIERLEYDHRPGNERLAAITIPEWLAMKKGMI
ncbi:hypothetical protein LCGC14_0471930 [marine sediment metagenome]|uniref:Uncharacterized protein n=1 Tax=marine sediment metagenome TaxID=412755 RepID=A0A0F9SUR6_9ZZZZ